LKLPERPINPCVYTEFCMEGEPLPYSLKISVGERRSPVQYFRNKQWYSILRCHFRACNYDTIPVVIFVRFYVTPDSNTKVSKKALKQEKMPAVKSFELSDYTLSFLEIIKQSLVMNYRQIVKIDAEKFYSSDPRTVFKFLRYDEYVHVSNSNTVHPETQSQCASWSKRCVQSGVKRYVPSRGLCERQAYARGTLDQSPCCCTPFCPTESFEPPPEDETEPTFPTMHPKAGP
jgi:hypothetical protein